MSSDSATREQVWDAHTAAEFDGRPTSQLISRPLTRSTPAKTRTCEDTWRTLPRQ